MIQRQAENGAVGRTFFGDEVDGLVLTEHSLGDAVGKLGELRPLAVGGQKEMFELAAIPIGNGGENEASVGGGLELYFRDAWEILPEEVGILSDGSSEFVKVDLLEKI